MGLFFKKSLDVLPPIEKLPELTFTVAGKEYWVGMKVKESGLRFEKEKDARNKLKGNKNTNFPVSWMRDKYGNQFYVGFINRGIETIEYKDAEIAFFLLDFSNGANTNSSRFFQNITCTSSLQDIQQVFCENSDFEWVEADYNCHVYRNDKADLSFAVDEAERIVEIQYNIR